MKPSSKSTAMDSALSDMFGIDRRDTITEDRCVPAPIGCGEPATEFTDAKSRKEFTISGLCQKCQNEIFGLGGVAPPGRGVAPALPPRWGVAELV